MSWELIKTKIVRRAVYILAGLLVVAILSLILRSIVAKPSPELGAAQLTNKLLKTTATLQTSFSDTGSPGKITKRYLNLMTTFQTTCRSMNDYQTALLRTETTESAIQRLRDSTSLCKELIKFTDSSRQVYKPAQPVLSINPHVKRYQTLPLLKNMIREQHAAKVAAAVRAAPEQAGDYPTKAKQLLKNVQNSLKTTGGFAYYPALRTAQTQLLAERQQYWTEYGDLSGLQQTLKQQLEGYCQELRGSDRTPSFCKV